MEDFNLIKEGSRRRRLIPYKVLYVKNAISHSYTLKETGKNIKLSDSAIFQLAQKSK